MTLKQFQIDFYHQLAGAGDVDQISQHTGLSHDKAKQRLAIYRDSILGSKQKVLKAIYPVCQKLLGEDCFAQMANAYLEVTPSRSPHITDIGADFADFIREYPLSTTLPYLADVARLEWIWYQVFHSENNEPLNLQKLSEAVKKYGDNIIFSYPRGARLFESLYPVDRIWQFCQPEYSGDPEINYDNDSVQLIIWQYKKTVCIERLNAVEFLFFTKLQNKMTWLEVCDELSYLKENADFIQLLPRLCQRDLICYQALN